MKNNSKTLINQLLEGGHIAYRKSVADSLCFKLGTYHRNTKFNSVNLFDIVIFYSPTELVTNISCKEDEIMYNVGEKAIHYTDLKLTTVDSSLHGVIITSNSGAYILSELSATTNNITLVESYSQDTKRYNVKITISPDESSENKSGVIEFSSDISMGDYSVVASYPKMSNVDKDVYDILSKFIDARVLEARVFLPKTLENPESEYNFAYKVVKSVNYTGPDDFEDAVSLIEVGTNKEFSTYTKGGRTNPHTIQEYTTINGFTLVNLYSYGGDEHESMTVDAIISDRLFDDKDESYENTIIRA